MTTLLLLVSTRKWPLELCAFRLRAISRPRSCSELSCAGFRSSSGSRRFSVDRRIKNSYKLFRLFEWLAYLLNSILISFFKRENFIRALLGIIDFLPSLVLFLLKQGDSICQKLGVTLNAINISGQLEI